MPKKYVIKTSRIVSIVISMFVIVGLLIPAPRSIPVLGASPLDWNEHSFWYEPWGTSGVHKGIDIFSPIGTRVMSNTGGILLYRGVLKKGGNVVVILRPRWKIHYYAHLDSIASSMDRVISAGNQIGLLGDSGNAKGKPAHLHYSIVTLLPYIWRISLETQGWKKMFYLNPEDYI